MVTTRTGHVYRGDAQDSTVDQHSSSGDTSPIKKRHQPDGGEYPKKRRRRREPICQLNLDVLFLIAKHIHPKDLLNLARTCKSLRELLMSKASEFVWKTARLQLDHFPDCPPDLNEPQYADLAFCPRCHGCGKLAKTVLWKIRRRFCSACKTSRLVDYYSCDHTIRDIAAKECLKIGAQKSYWADKDEIESLLNLYNQSVNKEQFLHEMRERKHAISLHASFCTSWESKRASERHTDLASRRYEREESIFRKLREYGYGKEIDYAGHTRVYRAHNTVFRKSKALTDEEWQHMLPAWCNAMDQLRSERLEETVYPLRQDLLAKKYNAYVSEPTPDGSMLDILPHVIDLVDFKLFENIIKAPEEDVLSNQLFTDAFEQLLGLVPIWKEKEDSALAASVKIPTHLFAKQPSNSKFKKPVTSGHAKKLKQDLSLGLACAQFHIDGRGPFSHPDIYHFLMGAALCGFTDDVNRLRLIKRSYPIQFIEEAVYIIHACGLDPSTATADDMDHRNARLMRLCCDGDIVMDWRTAICHATEWHVFMPSRLEPLSRWQLISDEHVDAIQAVEQSVAKSSPNFTRCLLCRPRVGDALTLGQLTNHLEQYHNMIVDAREGIHYRCIGMRAGAKTVRMATDEEGKVTFTIACD